MPQVWKCFFKKKKKRLWNSLVTQWVGDPVLSLLWTWVAAVAWVPSLAWALPHAVGVAKKKQQHQQQQHSFSRSYIVLKVKEKEDSEKLFIYLFIFVFLPFLGLHPRHMEVPRPGVESEL